MRYNVITLLIILTGFLLPVSQASAIVIKSIDPPKDNYEIHHRVIIYQNLSSYRRSGNRQSFTAQGLISGHSLDKYIQPLSMKNGNSPSEFSPDITNSIVPYSTMITPGNSIIPGKGQYISPQETVVGGFLDNLKDNPALRTIYFTSRDLIFGYRRNVTNVMQLGFNMDPDDYRKNRDFWGDNTKEDMRILTEREKKAIRQQTGLILGIVSQSYKDIFLILLALIGTLYLFLRYILNKYI